MSALAVPPSPRLRAVSAASAQEAVAVRLTALPGGGPSAPQTSVPAARTGRAVRDLRWGHLRLVPQDTSGTSASSVAGADGGVRALPVELTRRPTAVGRPSRPRVEDLTHSAPSTRDVPGSRLPVEDLAPAHPAVRAARARRERDVSRSRTARAQGPRVQAVPAQAALLQQQPRPVVAQRPEVPAALRRLALAVACVLAVVLLAAGAVVASGLAAAPERTALTTVQPGQSIWDLAAATGASDVAETAAQIVELNNLTSSTLQAGQTLLVPVG